MKTLNEVTDSLAQEYYHSYMSGSWSPWNSICKQVELAAFIYESSKEEISAQVDAKVKMLKG